MGLFDKINSAIVKRIQQSPKRYNGDLYFNFSQMVPPVSTMIGLSKLTKGGICQALSEMWIVYHSHESSMWLWLCPDNKVNSSAIANISYNFTYGSKEGKGVTDQDLNSDLWFLQYGIRRRTNIAMQVAAFSDVNKTIGTKSLTEVSRGGNSRMGQGRALAEALVGGSMVKNTGLGDGTYRMIGIRGKDAGHTMCAFVGHDVAFFDPNFGEFYFEKRADFARWFADFFWPKSFYDWVLSKSFEIRDYQRAVGAGPDIFAGKD